MRDKSPITSPKFGRDAAGRVAKKGEIECICGYRFEGDKKRRDATLSGTVWQNCVVLIGKRGIIIRRVKKRKKGRYLRWGDGAFPLKKTWTGIALQGGSQQKRRIRGRIRDERMRRRKMDRRGIF